MAIGRKQRADAGVRPTASPKTWTSAGLSANGRMHANAWRSDATTASCVSGIGRSTRAAARRLGGSVAASIISSIGVMPAIGSVGELAERVRHGTDEPAVDVDGATAHAGNDAGLGQRTAFEPGEDEIPARADMFRSTPMMLTLNSSSRSPSKTVRPIPIMPGRTSSIGKYFDWAGTPAMARIQTATMMARPRMHIRDGPRVSVKAVKLCLK